MEFSELKHAPSEALNPNGRVRAIEDPNTGVTLWESGAIIEYLVETYDKRRAISFGSASPEYYQAKQWLYLKHDSGCLETMKSRKTKTRTRESLLVITQLLTHQPTRHFRHVYRRTHSHIYILRLGVYSSAICLTLGLYRLSSLTKLSNTQS